MQSTTLKLCRLIVFGKFDKICKFENHVATDDVITKIIEKLWMLEKPVKL